MRSYHFNNLPKHFPRWVTFKRYVLQRKIYQMPGVIVVKGYKDIGRLDVYPSKPLERRTI